MSSVATGKHAIVIGAGIIGVCTANALLDKGFTVDVFDPAAPGSPDQCSYGNAGGICPGSCLPNAMPGLLKNVPEWLLDPQGPLFIRLSYLPHALPWLMRFVLAGRKSRVEKISQAMNDLHRLSYEAYEPLMAEAGCLDLLQKRGQLFVFEDRKGPEGSAYGVRLRRSHGVKVETLSARDIQDLEPALSAQFKSALYLPDQGQCPNPGRLVEKLAELAQRKGATFHREPVNGFMYEMGEASGVITPSGNHAADRIVLAAGAWSGDLARQLGDRIPFETERGYHVMLPQADTGLKIQTISADRKFVASPMEAGLRLAGTVEFAGLKEPPNYARADSLVHLAQGMFKRFEPSEVHRWMGHRPGTPDSIPVIDTAKRHARVTYAFGHGHQGLIGGAVTGRIVADMSAGLRPAIDLSPFRLDRFGLRNL
ncbi:FAD-dependent oxidoreductase [Roseovarius aestuarii]|nr:FAD-dependent oxidoreductase [Roseovarius aestuarii]